MRTKENNVGGSLRRPGSIAEARSVLIVEDDIDQRESLSELLALNGYLVSCAENGKDALDKLSKAPIPPALILLDLTMPVMDGWAFMRRFRPHKRRIPVLVMTAEDSPSVPGAAAVLNKPFKPAALLSCLEQFLS